MLSKVEAAKEKFGALMVEQLKRVEAINQQQGGAAAGGGPVVIGTVGGDGIGPAITRQAQRVMEYLLRDEIAAGKVVMKEITSLTIENRLEKGKAIPDDCLEELKQCTVILKGPTTTPQAGQGTANIESANVRMRKELDLFANVRPVCVPEQGIDWTFFRENTEGAYALGSSGFDVDGDLAVDFTVATTPGSKRIIRAAFEYAKANGKTKVTAVTKSNVVKTTDGKFSLIFFEIAKEYPEIAADEWYIDIMTANLINERRRRDFQVMVLPNLYGDILTDEAAEFQGGVGTAGSANLGTRYAMFEAIHGSAPRMVDEGREIYANPVSIMRAAAMLLAHIGYSGYADKFQKALDICTITEKKMVITGRSNGCTTQELADYVMETINKL